MIGVADKIAISEEHQLDHFIVRRLPVIGPRRRVAWNDRLLFERITHAKAFTLCFSDISANFFSGQYEREEHCRDGAAAMRHHDKLQIIAFFAKLVFTSLAMMNEAPAGKGARVAVTRLNPGRERRA